MTNIKILTALGAALCMGTLYACGGGGSGATSSPAPVAGPPPSPPVASPPTANVVGEGPFIVLDQFGYLPDMKKVAVIRDPQTGFDADDSLTPGETYDVINIATDTIAFTGAPVPWKDGATDDVSGDKIWHLDFSPITTPGAYVVQDRELGVVSAAFEIGDDIYTDALRDAVRVFFYQRAGHAKSAPFADARWTDSASHMGPGQDTQARRYDSPHNAATELDLHGGWYDAGDYNRYTNWNADYVLALLNIYAERPDIWGDDLNIPESGNGVPDILDEVKWGLDWLVRMQNHDGSVLAILGSDSDGSPPSLAGGPSYYGHASTSATLSSAAAFARASEIFDSLPAHLGFGTYANDLAARAETAWSWTELNPDQVFYNNDAASGTDGLGFGQQEVEPAERAEKFLSAAMYLHGLTRQDMYGQYVENHLDDAPLIGDGYIIPFHGKMAQDLMIYAARPGTSDAVRANIQGTFEAAMENDDGWRAVDNQTDPYGAHLKDYTWGSNSIKARQGALYVELEQYGLSGRGSDELRAAAAGYLHYLHGANPLGLVYVSNMEASGAEHSVDTFYHGWFADGSAKWDSVKTSEFGPAPGFVTGGPNPFYDWDECCPNACGAGNNDLCGVSQPSPPYGQPLSKSYAQFNDSWPLNSWEITENSNSYQVAYIRLLARFAN